MNYKGVIIQESLENPLVLNEVKVLGLEVEKVTEEHKTPWVEYWFKNIVEIPEEKVQEIAEKISFALDSQHNWYADFKNEEYHYIIYRNKVFKVDRTSKEQYEEVIKYGISLGIPEYQLDFSPEIE